MKTKIKSISPNAVRLGWKKDISITTGKKRGYFKVRNGELKLTEKGKKELKKVWRRK